MQHLLDNELVVLNLMAANASTLLLGDRLGSQSYNPLAITFAMIL